LAQTHHFCGGVVTPPPNRVFDSAMRVFLTTLIISVLGTFAQAQNVHGVGTWREHFPFKTGVDVCIGPDKSAYCASDLGLFRFDASDNSLTSFTKVNGLSDVAITSLNYDIANSCLVVGYDNGNLDLVYSNGSVLNIPDIRLTALQNVKTIHHIEPYNGLLYLATAFGIVVVDPARAEVKNTYFINDDGGSIVVNDIEIHAGYIYAATERGLRRGDINDPFLSNYASWLTLSSLPGNEVAVSEVDVFQDMLLAILPADAGDVVWKQTLTADTWSVFWTVPSVHFNGMWSDETSLCFASDAAYTVWDASQSVVLNQTNHQGKSVNASAIVGDGLAGYYVADARNGLLWKKANGEELSFAPVGPERASVKHIDAYNNNLWIAHGGVNQAWGNLYNITGVSGLVDDQWYDVAPVAGENDYSDILDFLDVAIDPLDVKRVMVSSWDEGVVELYDKQVVNIYSYDDNVLDAAGFSFAPQWIGIAALDYDENGVLWIGNSYSTSAIHAKDRQGNFYGFDFSSLIVSNTLITDIFASSGNLIYAVANNQGILVLDHKGTISDASDDEFKLLTNVAGSGGLPTNDVICMQEDLLGSLWVGTSEGVAVFYNQDAIFTSDSFDAEQIYITQDGNTQLLLQTEVVSAIKINGANEKWVGTTTGGLYLFSADGTQQIYHFTKDNSPLPSNNIYDIAINQNNGEVFIATERGMVSFFALATNFDQDMKSIRAYPNPVTEDYEGEIVIDGLAYESNVRITDIQGNVVYETTSSGGRASWNGKLNDGRRPASGVYLIFTATSDGKTENSTKITFIK
jgi:hypothetical protein